MSERKLSEHWVFECDLCGCRDEQYADGRPKMRSPLIELHITRDGRCLLEKGPIELCTACLERPLIEILRGRAKDTELA